MDRLYTLASLARESEAVNRTLDEIVAETKEGGSRMTEQEKKTVTRVTRSPLAHIAGTSLGCFFIWRWRKNAKFQSLNVLTQALVILPVWWMPFTLTRNLENLYVVGTMLESQTPLGRKLRKTYSVYAPAGSQTVANIRKRNKDKRQKGSERLGGFE
uniref:Uncharacterized protein n=1 Tax=Chromera velia CCMP2878 TaxID=1169474 RepID=A0A0G4GL31_9ALVE|mmetsp:Transcript_226/g.565  ORF Transcript_226/g.565 Transcript_226/m.565 type:complete len:157 (+) Transcript_226:237-707(+)|eukprot:Cvel_22390.t1-p1 / transcript=Cvel_22390.t1 / gene=Cvel_22390 / organism=Chromera_velia_CCMP2878 / gene_product=hypothetical protein / transcript_product=hypothetical protein / location=Cvel_scaffold2195:19416-22020(-) / protein_length=156 / sequence_SO=supercontig / SO=protein_coding / is_pseudo=false